MIGFDELVRRVAGLDAAELSRWVENRWILPERDEARETRRWVFHEVDIARVELILHIRRDFAVDDEATELVLGLLDQVYSLRRQMRRLCQALEGQPPEIRDAIRNALPPSAKAPERGSGPRASRPQRAGGPRPKPHKV
jgi:chaperone modulatory protein CbpM